MEKLKIVFRTNIDLRNERFPNDFPFIPRVGDEIESMTKREGKRLKLKVSYIEYVYNEISNRYDAEAWLIIPSSFRNLSEFHEWYDKFKKGRI